VRLILLSDIHGNLEALDAVRDSIKEEDADKVYCLGDVVGYGADPEACWRTVADEGWETVLGNHDQAVLDPSGLPLMNPVARTALEWTREHTSKEGIEWLARLKMEIPLSEDSLASHALPIKPDQWLYSDDPQLVLGVFRARPERIFWVGHLHFAHAWLHREDTDQLLLERTPEEIKVVGGKWLLNVGSVGQPRDGDHRACYVVYDMESGVAYYRRIQYDTVTAAKKIIDAGLPEILAQRLFLGQ